MKNSSNSSSSSSSSSSSAGIELLMAKKEIEPVVDLEGVRNGSDEDEEGGSGGGKGREISSPCTVATCLYTFVPVSIEWNFHTNPYHPSETTSWNNKVTAPVKPQLRQIITSCRARAGQHARPLHKHCKACAKHARAPWPRAFCTRLYGFHFHWVHVAESYQPMYLYMSGTNVYTCMYMYMYVCTGTCTFMYVCMYMYVYTHILHMYVSF